MAKDSVPTLADMPVELFLEIFHRLDISSIFKLARTSKHIRNIFLAKRAGILLPILQREFGPFDELLQAYTATEEDLDSPGMVCLPKRIVFKRELSDTGLVLAEGPHKASDFSYDDFVKIIKTRAVPGSAPAQSKGRGTVVLRESDINGILEWCALVRQWEDLFPRLRFIEMPAHCRFLDTDEKERLRKALYRWWLYAIHFHGDFNRPRPGLPEPFVDDVRTGQLRTYSTSELYELLDLQVTVEDLIKYYFFPTLLKDAELVVDPESHVDDSWAHVDPNVRGRVLRTYAKLTPKDFMHYYENLYSFSKDKLITHIKIRHPGFTYDQASLRDAISAVLVERAPFTKNTTMLTAWDTNGGILEYNDTVAEATRLYLSKDAKADGSLPFKAKFARPKSYHSPRGDDGCSMDEDAIDAARYTDTSHVSSRPTQI